MKKIIITISLFYTLNASELIKRSVRGISSIATTCASSTLEASSALTSYNDNMEFFLGEVVEQIGKKRTGEINARDFYSPTNYLHLLNSAYHLSKWAVEQTPARGHFRKHNEEIGKFVHKKAYSILAASDVWGVSPKASGYMLSPFSAEEKTQLQEFVFYIYAQQFIFKNSQSNKMIYDALFAALDALIALQPEQDGLIDEFFVAKDEQNE